MSKPDAYQACGEARIECEKPRHKKPGTRPGFRLLVAGRDLCCPYSPHSRSLEVAQLALYDLISALERPLSPRAVIQISRFQET